MNIFDPEYRTKWQIEWEAHCERVRAERLRNACPSPTEPPDRLWADLYNIDEEHDLGYLGAGFARPIEWDYPEDRPAEPRID